VTQRRRGRRSPEIKVRSVNKPDPERAAAFIAWLIEETLRRDPDFFTRNADKKRGQTAK